MVLEKGQCTFDSFLAMEYTIEDPKMELLFGTPFHKDPLFASSMVYSLAKELPKVHYSFLGAVHY